jgi:uncharacterized protein YbjT (DUF2867 family)
VQRAYFCAPVTPGYLTAAATFATVARSSKLEFLVAMGQWLSDPSHPSIQTRECFLSDSILASIPGVGLTINNVGFFADNYMAAMDTIAQMGMLPMPLGQGRNAPPSNDDIARINVGALADPAAHAGKSYRPTGPKLLTPDEIAATFAKVLGRPVFYKPVSLAFFNKVMKAMNVLPDYSTSVFLHVLQDYAKDAFAIGAPTDAVERVSGRPPESFETIVGAYVQNMNTRPSVGGKLEQAFFMMKAALGGKVPVGELNHAEHFSKPANAHYSADSSRWLATHGSS